ncbi:MAG: hypothetical protein R8F63_02255 [Acidimicrobiales bacterium]|nr:hypothetical protein [Acidimicrobiales bacterium]
MLTSITPLGERGRGNRWRITAAWLVAGHLVGGAALGGVLAGLGALAALAAPDLFSGGGDDTTVVAVVAAVAGLGVAFDLAGGRIPGRRQVDERWLNTYRGWVYGFGFGVQLGVGMVTVVNTALFAAVLVAGLLLSPPAAFGLSVLYAGTRGIAAVASGRVRSVADLHRLHQALDRSERVVQRSLLAAVATVASVAVVAVTL